MRVDMSNVDGKQIYDDKISGKRDSNSVSNEELKKIGFNQKKYTELMHKSGCNDYKVSDDTPIPFYTPDFRTRPPIFGGLLFIFNTYVGGPFCSA